MDDYVFYGESNDTVVKEVKGITEEVTSYTYTGITYPCVVFNEGFKCPKHKMTVIGHMVKPPTRRHNESFKGIESQAEDTSVGLYFSQNGELYKMGSLSGMQFGAFLDLVGTDSVKGYYDENTQLVDDHLYALCTA